ncbi:MAG: amidase, partial [Polyangiales bacterium]
MFTATELARRIRDGESSAREVLDEHLARIERINPALNAIVTLDVERARIRAREADEALARGESWGPLHGVPFTLKDAHETAGVRTTVGLPAFAENIPTADGTVAARLKSAGAILLGKTNVPPMLMSARTDNPVFGRTNNPWDLGRTPGGSSGGSGAAVAAGLVPFDVGSDMSGSIRIPAHFCGIFGLKPTANRLPTTGHLPPLPGMPRIDRMLATVGPMARSVEDLALVASVLAGPDGVDLEVPPVPWRDEPTRTARSLRIAYLPVFPGVPTARAIVRATSELAAALSREGAHVEERLPGFSVEAFNEVWREAFVAMSGVLVELTGMSMPVKAPDAPPMKVVDWIRMLDRRDALVRVLDGLLADFDAFMCPASIVQAFPHSPPRTPIEVDGTMIDSRFVDHYLYPFSFTGHPAVVVPAAIANGLPIGVQLVGRRWGDERLLAVAAAVSTVTGGFRAPPGVM